MLNTEMPVQVDGEAWLVPPGKITITKLPVQVGVDRWVWTISVPAQ